MRNYYEGRWGSKKMSVGAVFAATRSFVTDLFIDETVVAADRIRFAAFKLWINSDGA